MNVALAGSQLAVRRMLRAPLEQGCRQDTNRAVEKEAVCNDAKKSYC